jgi:hypothetical protein
MPTDEFKELSLEKRVSIRMSFIKLWLQQIELVDYYRKLAEQEGNILIEGIAKELLDKFSLGQGPTNEEIQEFWILVNKSCIDSASIRTAEQNVNELLLNEKRQDS